MTAQTRRALEDRFRKLTLVLYDTSVPPAVLDAEVTPYLDERVRFTDPWQQARGRERYRLGAAGFHSLFRFDFEIFQLNVQLDADGVRGRALVDGVMNLKQFKPLLVYPLRTFLRYDFTVDGPPAADGEVAFRITDHEEMWSLADMIEAVPVAGWLYRKLFRPGFSVGFLGASWLASRAKGFRVPK